MGEVRWKDPKIIQSPLDERPHYLSQFASIICSTSSSIVFSKSRTPQAV